jgi:hypothetical protein
MRLFLGLGFLSLAVLFAFLRGGGPERWIAGVLMGMFVVDRAGHLLSGSDDLAVLYGLHLAIDLLGFATMILVMVRARRFWPIWACSFQLLSLVSYATPLMSERLSPVVPDVLAIAPSYLICASLILGTALHQARLRRHANDPPWRTSSPLAAGRARRATRINF